MVSVDIINSFEVVLCNTEEQAKSFLEKLNEKGIKWDNGDSLLEKTNWDVYKSETCYRIQEGFLSYNNVTNYVVFDNCQILDVSFFIEEREVDTDNIKYSKKIIFDFTTHVLNQNYIWENIGKKSLFKKVLLGEDDPSILEEYEKYNNKVINDLFDSFIEELKDTEPKDGLLTERMDVNSSDTSHFKEVLLNKTKEQTKWQKINIELAATRIKIEDIKSTKKGIIRWLGLMCKLLAIRSIMIIFNHEAHGVVKK